MAYTIKITSFSYDSVADQYIVTFQGTWAGGVVYSATGRVPVASTKGRTDSQIAALAWAAGPKDQMSTVDGGVTKPFSLVGQTWVPPA